MCIIDHHPLALGSEIKELKYREDKIEVIKPGRDIYIYIFLIYINCKLINYAQYN